MRCTCFAFVEGADASAPVRGIARLVDVTSRGVGLVLAREVPVGSRVAVELVLQEGLRLRGRGDVVHCRPVSGGQTRVGIQLDSAPVLADEAIEGGDSWRT